MLPVTWNTKMLFFQMVELDVILSLKYYTYFQTVCPGVLQKIFQTLYTLLSPKMAANFKQDVCRQNFL